MIIIYAKIIKNFKSDGSIYNKLFLNEKTN